MGLPVRYFGVAMKREIANGVIEGPRSFHIDPEDENVLKIIVYLNDVDAGTGPRRQPRCWRNVPKDSVPLRAN